MEPPWLKHPNIPAGSIGWRMNGGEDYLARFEAWFGGLSATEQEAYARANCPPQEWRTYSIFRHPPWPRPNAFHQLMAVNTATLLLVLIAVAIVAAVTITASR
jgi:hypothetical protein